MKELEVGDRVKFKKSFLQSIRQPCTGPFGQARGNITAKDGDHVIVAWGGSHAGFFPTELTTRAVERTER